MSPRETDDPQHRRNRAAQMRSLAIKMADSDAAILMNDLAAEYESSAESAAIKANGKKPRSNGKRARKCGAVSIAGGLFDWMASGKRKPPAPGGGRKALGAREAAARGDDYTCRCPSVGGVT
jgi:hypothetical protein